MHCPVCETPLLRGPGIGIYCPNLECDSHEGKDEGWLEALDAHEPMRQKRDGKAYAGMQHAVWVKMYEKSVAESKRVEGVWRALRLG
jgi:uncharacterized Zn finger protein (UPF0148 family)